MNFEQSSFNQAAGRLTVEQPARAKGKKVFTWQFTPVAMPGGKPEPIDLEVVLVERDGRLLFRLEHELLPAGALENCDIEALRSATNLHLQQQFALKRDLVWEDWLEVKVSGDSRLFSPEAAVFGAELCLKVSKLKRGCDVQGNAFTVNNFGRVVPFPTSSRLMEEIAAQEGKIRLQEEAERAYVPATPANLQALADLSARLVQLRNQMADFLEHEGIQDRLANMPHAGALLPFSTQS